MKRGELFLLPTIDAYFDDLRHFDEIKSVLVIVRCLR